MFFSEIVISPPSRTARRDLPLQQKEAKPKQRNRGKRKEVRGVGGRMVGVFSEIVNYPPSITARRDLPPQQKEAKPKQRREERAEREERREEKNAGERGRRNRTAGRRREERREVEAGREHAGQVLRQQAAALRLALPRSAAPKSKHNYPTITL